MHQQAGKQGLVARAHAPGQCTHAQDSAVGQWQALLWPCWELAKVDKIFQYQMGKNTVGVRKPVAQDAALPLISCGNSGKLLK